MVVLSRNKGGAPKAAPKLSVPPPLNLPSLRKEHEKFDILGPGGGPGGGAGAGGGSRPTSSGVGWTKPVAAATVLPDKSESGLETLLVDGMGATDGAGGGTGSYMPPSARSNGAGVVGSASASRNIAPSADKAMVLRGEDFPSLQAVRPVSSGGSQKQKEGLNQKQKLVGREELAQDMGDSYHLGPVVDMHQHGQSSRGAVGSRLVENGGESHGLGNGRVADQVQKQQKYFSDPLPLVRMNPRSDWADDERDTGHGFVERGRDSGYSNSDSYWDRDFDLPRPSILPQKPAQNQYDRRGQRDNEAGKKFSSEVLKVDPYHKDVRAPSREGKEVNKLRTSPLSKERFSPQEVGNYRNDVGARMTGHNNMVNENKYNPPHYGDTGRDGSGMLNRDSTFGRRDVGLVGRQQRNNSMESFNNRGADRYSWDRHVTEQPNRYRGDHFLNNASSKPSISSSGKMPPLNDPILTMGRDKRYSRSDRSFSEDPFSRDFGSSGFDERDLFSGGLVGVIKRKKDAAKSTDFHDPVRESFEAELERVQKIQELERQRIMEEQERALEHARREEEDRQRRIRDEEERRRRLEEEAREAAWKAEQERLEAIRKAEEQRIAREEEKRRIQMEEERRKQAAKQKLQELEARMARRQAEATKGDASMSNTIVDEKLEAAVKEKNIPTNLNLDTWEDGERMVETVTASASFDSSAHSRPVEMSSRLYPHRESSSNLLDRGKAISSWRRDEFETGDSFRSPLLDQDIGHYSPRRDAFGGGRSAPRKEFHGGAGYMPSRAYLQSGVQEPYSDEFGYQKDHRWGLPGDADSYGKPREIDSEYHDSAVDNYGDNGWGQGYLRGNARPPYPERFYPHSEANELYSYGKSRYSMRQPRVLPPPSVASSQRSHLRVPEHSGSSTFIDDIHYTHAARTESTRQTAYYGSNRGGLEQSEVVGQQRDDSILEDQKLNDTSRYDSQSSLSVSSPPNSPPHLSHDELDESGDSPVTSAVAEGKRSLLTESGSVILNGNAGNGTIVMQSDHISAIEDEEWTENDDTLQQPEEYDEDEDGYREEDEMREGDDGNLEINQKFEGLDLQERESAHMMDNVVLGFDEGVEVVIPSDDLEKSSGAEERSFGMLNSSAGVMKERDPVDGFPSVEQSLLPADNSYGTSAASSPGNVPERSALEGSIDQPVGTPYPAAVDLVDRADSSGSTGLAAQHTVSASGDVPAAVGQTSMPSLTSAGSQTDLPVKLQFGLFSGPSLIPSPVPAIQIGSIQMPLHIHPPVGPSLPHLHPSQSPMFQFGQLRYTSPISQGILPMAPPSVSFTQPNMPAHFNPNQKAGGSVPQPAQDASTQNVTTDEAPSLSVKKQPSVVSAPPEQSNGSLSQGPNPVLGADSREDNSIHLSESSGISGASDKKIKSESGSQAEEKGKHDTVLKTRGSEGRLQHAQPRTQSVSSEKNFSAHRGLGLAPGGRGKRFAYAVKNANTGPSFQTHDMPAQSNGFQRRPRRTVQRTEFRIREKDDRRPAPVLDSPNNTELNDKSNYAGKAVGVFTRSGSKRGTISNRTLKHRAESESSAPGNIVSHEINSGDTAAKEWAKKSTIKSQNTIHPGEADLRRSVSEEDVDAPLQSGVVRVFKQPGIEAPSDEDDFIEVRSKRQMLNDRREQREKEIKAKSRTNKPPRRPRSTRQKDVVSRSHNKLSVPSGSEEPNNSRFASTAPESRLANNEGSTGFVAATSQHLISTPAVNSEVQAIKPPQAGAVPVVSSVGAENDAGPIFESKNKVMDHVESSSTTWSTTGVSQQTQNDEALKPARYDSHMASVGGHSSTVGDPILPTPSILTKDKTFSSGASPINSLLAGEKIQFGAVTSPTVLPPSGRVVSNGIGAPGSNRPDAQMSRNFSVSENENSLFFEKEKHLSDSCGPLQDSEAEAEAAASAVAVAAISSDEIVGNGVGSLDNTKSFDASDIDGITSGAAGDQRSGSQSRSEELSVSLPADLSVETTPISLWPPLPSPQSSSNQMLSHFPGGPPSHFPFYEMNPLLGGQIFAFSPHEESSGTQSQPQKSSSSSSGPLSNWQQCHSGVDSFYGHPAGYPGQFISPPGGIPGVQGPPHMVVYNHFAPVGQYGQVGLSFMGTTYIPSGKQADWKNTQTSSAMHIGEGEVNNMSMTNVPRNSANMTAPIQHLAPGSPLLPMPSPLAMFDVSPFQSGPDLPVQARWGHIPASQLHSAAVSRPLQSQVEGALPSQVNHRHTIDQSLAVNRSRVPASSDNSPSFAVAGDTNIAPFPAELGLVDSLRSTTASSGQSSVVQSSPGNSNAESCKADALDSALRHNGRHQNSSSVKTRFSQKSAANQQGSATGYNNYQRGGMSQRNNEWSHRRMGFHGRNQSGGVDKGYPASKVKQIYVAKQTARGSST